MKLAPIFTVVLVALSGLTTLHTFQRLQEQRRTTDGLHALLEALESIERSQGDD